MDYVLRTNNLNKSYKKHQVLNNVNITIKKGEIYGFVGENGSGKTTIIRLITGLIFADSGDFELFGVNSKSSDISRVRSKVGAVVESPSIYLNMSAKENLEMQGRIIGCTDQDKIFNTLKEVGLEYLYDQKKKAGNFSLGMRQRLGIAMALLGDPEFLLLDEPMNGLDPAGIVEIRELILKLNRERGITFLISSHILTELALVATTYGIISKGKIIKEITSAELEKVCKHSFTIKVSDKEKLLSLFPKGIDNADLYSIDDGIKIVGEVNINQILNTIINADVKIVSINTFKSSIEDYYLSLIGGNKNA